MLYKCFVFAGKIANNVYSRYCLFTCMSFERKISTKMVILAYVLVQIGTMLLFTCFKLWVVVAIHNFKWMEFKFYNLAGKG